MKTALYLFVFLFSYKSFSATRLQFFIGDHNAMAILTPMDSYGNADSDSTDLFQIMNVPEQDTMLGKGKSIVSGDRDFNLVCGEYKNQCQFILNRSVNVRISGTEKSMRFAVGGEKAARLTELFKVNSNGEAFFQTADKMLLLKGSGNEFVFEANLP